MLPNWLQIATGPGLWIISGVFAGNALVQSFLFTASPAASEPGYR
jgi:hypothetical protein